MAKFFMFVNDIGDWDESDAGAYEISDFLKSPSTDPASDEDSPIILDVDGTINPGFIDITDFINDSASSIDELWSSAKIDSEITRIDDIFLDMSEPTGFVDRTESEISFNPTTRLFTIIPSGSLTEYDIYSQGTKITISSTKTVTIPDNSGSHYIYFDGSTLNSTQTFSENLILGPWVYVAYIYYNTDGDQIVLLGEERHGLKMDGDTHSYLHSIYGTAYESGFQIGGYTENSDTDSDIQFSLTGGVIRDEDIRMEIINGTGSDIFEQDLADPAKLPIWYREGNPGNWKTITNTGGDAGVWYRYGGTGTRVDYNFLNGSTWEQKEVTDGSFTEYWIFVTNDINNPVVSVQGQEEFATLELANTGATTRLNTLLANLPSKEFRPLYRIVLEVSESTPAYASKGNTVIADVEDLRRSNIISDAVAGITDHGGLSGLTDQDHPASAIFTNTSGWTGSSVTGNLLTPSDDDVQKALASYNAHNHDDRYFTETELGGVAIDLANHDHSGGDGGQIDHGSLAGLLDDDHTQYILVDGSRDFTGNQSMGGNKLTNVGTGAASITDPTDAANKAYVDAVATGLQPKGNVQAATTVPLIDNATISGGISYDGDLEITATLATSGVFTVDTYSVQNGDRILIKDEQDETDGLGAIANGIYVATISGTSLTLTRSDDQDNSPLAEVVNGVFIPQVLYGNTNINKSFLITSVGTATNTSHEFGTDDIIWEQYSTPSVLQPGNGIEFVGNVINVDLVDTNSGLKFVSGELAVEPDHFAGDGLVDDGSDNLAIDWATSPTDDKAWKASDLNSSSGATYIGIDNSTGSYWADLTGIDTVQEALDTLADLIGGSGNYDFTEENVLTDGDGLYEALDKLDLQWGDLFSTANGEGASLVGVEDSAGYYSNSNVEGVLTEIQTQLGGDSSTTYDFTSDGIILADNDFIYPALDKLNEQWGELFSTTNGQGASLVGVEDSAGYFDGTNVESVLAEIGEELENGTNLTFTALGAITKGDLVYISGDDQVSTYSNISNYEFCIGIANETVANGAPVDIVSDHSLVTGVLGSGFTSGGDPLFWNGTTYIEFDRPTFANKHRYIVGVPVNANDLYVEIEYRGRNGN